MRLAEQNAIAPFQGCAILVGSVPRAAPWAIILQPFRLHATEFVRAHYIARMHAISATD